MYGNRNTAIAVNRGEEMMRMSMLRNLLWGLFGICLVLFAPMAWGACGGGISGNVSDTAASPIAGVTIKVFNAANRVEVASTTTAYYPTPGGYSVTGLPSGNYRVSFEYNSLIPLALNGYLGEWYDNKSGYDTATTIPVGSTIVTGKSGTLAAAGSIHGTVTDVTGTGIFGVKVNVFNAGHTSLGSAVTAGDGTYTVKGLPTGSYRVSFQRSLDSCGSVIWYNAKSSFASATTVAVTVGSQTTGINATLPSGRITGVVKDASSLVELSSIYVSAYDATTGSYSTSTVTDNSGAYDLELPPGSYKLFFEGAYTGYVSRWYNNAYTQSAATAVTVTNGTTTTRNQNLAMGATISGTVTYGGTPVEGVSVTAYESSLGENDDNPISAETDSDGNYTLQGLRSGVAYKINFDGSYEGYLEEWYNNRSGVGTADPVTSTIAAPLVNVNATLARGGTITGTVQGPCGALGNILVFASDSSHTTVVSDLTAANGSFSLKGLPTGTYTVSLGSYSIYAPASRTANVTVPTTTTLAAVTLAMGGSISGRVTDTSGWGIDSAVVDVVDGTGTTLATATTDGNGYYVVGGLATGSYRVKATASDCSGNFQWYNNQASVAVSAPSGTAGINITIGGTIPTATLTVVNNGGGTVTSSPAGINCPGTCSATLPQGVVSLTAQYAVGYAFTGWSGGGCSGAGTCQVNLSSNTTVTASFTASSHTLQVTVAGDGKGTVTSTPTGFTCASGTCSKSYGNGYQISLNAAPSTGSVFDGWSGGLCAGTGVCALTLTSNTSTTATFSIPKEVRMGGTYYHTIMGAYGNASDGGKILARNQLFSETFTLNRGVAVSLEGGYASDFLNVVGVSTLTGPVIITDGQVTMEDIAIK